MREGPRALGTLDDARERAFAQACVYGVLRHYHALSGELSHYVHRPLRERDFDITAALLSSLYQLHHMRVPAHAAVSAGVETMRELDKPWACKLANAVLRAAIRGEPPARPAAAADEYPPWLAAQTAAAWPEHATAVLEAGNQQAPLTLRVNLARTTRDACLDQLRAHGLAAHPGAHAPSAVVLETPMAIEQLPGFEAGEISVQDEAAQLAADLLAPRAGQYILDACAAPGGKTAHLLEYTAGELDLVALDRDAGRLNDVGDNLARLGFVARLLAVDAAAVDQWWDGRPFARILLDAPCSAVGVMRRHPDIRFHRRADDITRLAAEQARLLAALWRLLAPGGTLLYVTCSYLPAENDDVIDTLLAADRDAEICPIDADWGLATRHGRQVLPGMHDMDGFYFARLRRRGSPP